MDGGGSALAGHVIAVLLGFVSNQAQDSPHNVADNQLARLGGDQSAAHRLNTGQKLIYVAEAVPGHNLEQNMGRREGAWFGTMNLPSLEESVVGVSGELCAQGGAAGSPGLRREYAYETRDSIEASTGLPFKLSMNNSRLGV